MTTPPFDSADPELIEEVISQAQVRLQAQLTLGLAADQRAMTFAGMLFAAVAIIVTLATATSSGLGQTPELLPMAIGFILAACLACWSARPVKWHSPGNFPSSWTEDVAAGRTHGETRAETASNYEALLKGNEKALGRAAGFMRASMFVAFIAASAGVISVAT